MIQVQLDIEVFRGQIVMKATSGLALVQQGGQDQPLPN
jgi:hypothetical protein